MPRDLQELAVRIEHVTDELTGELGRAPTPGEIARHCGTTTEHVMEARGTASAHRAISLDAPQNDDDDRRGPLVGGDDACYALAERTADLDHLLAALPEREQTVLRLRFHEDLTQSETGERMGVRCGRNP